MKLVTRLLSAAGLAALLVLVAAHGRPVARRDSPVVAVIGDATVTLDDLDRQLATLPERVRATFEQPDRKREFLEHLVGEALLARAAEHAGLAREPTFRVILEDTRRGLLANYYRDRRLRPLAIPDSAYIERYYGEHPEEFTVSERVTGRQVVLATEEEAREVRRRLEADEPFAPLLERSIDDETRPLGGALGVVRLGVPVRGLGVDDAFVERLFELGPGDISEPIRTKLGYHVVVVETHDAERTRALESVWESLERRLQPDRYRDLQAAALDSLREAFGVVIDDRPLYSEAGYRAAHTRELFDRAEAETDPATRLEIYREILDSGPEDRHAAQARFMRGFIFIEELRDLERGRRELERVIEDYPESELVDSARWMLENGMGSSTTDSD